MKRWIKSLMERRMNVSFSRSGDDLQLMKLINASTPGSYVDVGSWHPLKASNTYHFYLRGWKGICIDPNPELAAAYRKFRRNDIFENAAAGTDIGEVVKYYMFRDGYDSMNTLDGDFVKKNRLEDKIKQIIDVPIKPLSDILKEHITNTDRLDFFDIDAEGFDLKVLQSNDWNLFRPSIVVTETEMPLRADLDSEVSTYLEGVGYRLVGKTTIKGDLGNLYYIRK